jgi:hypothetical protein
MTPLLLRVTKDPFVSRLLAPLMHDAQQAIYMHGPDSLTRVVSFYFWPVSARTGSFLSTLIAVLVKANIKCHVRVNSAWRLKCVSSELEDGLMNRPTFFIPHCVLQILEFI